MITLPKTWETEIKWKEINLLVTGFEKNRKDLYLKDPSLKVLDGLRAIIGHLRLQ